jgi:hypothetical protein
VYHEGDRGSIGPTTISRTLFDNSIFVQESLVASAAPDRKHGAASEKLQNEPDIALFRGRMNGVKFPVLQNEPKKLT